MSGHRTLLRSGVAVTFLAAVVSCVSGPDLAAVESTSARPNPAEDDSTATPPVPATTTEPATTRTTATTATPASTPTTDRPSTTTTTAPRPAPVVSATVIDLREDLSAAGAVELVPAFGDRGHLLIGWEQEERRPSEPRVWESADGLRWAEAPAPTAPDDQSGAGVVGAAWSGSTLAIGGVTETFGVGPRAAVWLATDGRNFPAPPELPIGDADSVVSAIASSTAGLVVAGWIDDADEDTTFVAVRTAEGSWHRAELPALPDFGARGIAASGSTIVVTGSDGTFESQASAALVSTDGGLTFELADTSALVGGLATGLGPVAATPEGFVAVACAPSSTGHMTALARSADGVVWSRQDLQVVPTDDGDQPQLVDAGCSSLRADGSRVLIGVVDLEAWVLTVEPSGRASARRAVRGQRRLAVSGPFVAPTPMGTVVVSNDYGGFTPSILESGSIGRGLPIGAPGVDGIALHDDLGAMLVEVVMFPKVDDDPGGRYEWAGYRRWFQAADDGSFDPTFHGRNLDVIATTPFGVVGLERADDAADGGESGPKGDTEAFMLDERDQWRRSAMVSSGTGSEIVADLTAVGMSAVGVGTATRRDPQTDVTTWAPLVRSTSDGITWTEELVPLPADAVGGLRAACTMTDRVIAYGWQVAGGVESKLVAVRDADGGWSVAEPSGLPSRSSLATCSPDGIVHIAADGDRSSVAVSTDGITFTSADLDADAFTDTTFHDIDSFGAGFVAVGPKLGPGRDVNGALWTSPDGLTWSEVALDGMDGFGSQAPVAMQQAPDGSLVLAGYELGAPTVWTVPTGVF
ncbi:MAG: hypothetical protein ACR2HP_00400 [Ilumatobacteraceae bacterium]